MLDKLVVFVANVGERDLYYNVGDASHPDFCHFELGKDDGERVAKHLKCQNGARYIANSILVGLKNDSSEAQRLRYPILRTVLDEVLESGKTLDRLILIVTDQPEGTAEQFRRRDSLYTGAVLKQLIERQYQGHVKEVRIARYRGNPSNREQAYRFFGDALPQLAPNARVEELHAALSGGVPALNDSLQEQALRLYKTKCRFYEVVPPSEEEARAGAVRGTLQPVSAKPFLRDLAISIIEQLLGRYDYSGALEVLEMFRAVRFWDEKVEAALRHAERRINLDFRGAARAIQGYRDDPSLGQWSQAISQADQLGQLVETYYIAKARCEHHEYADFLWRVRLIWESTKEEVYNHLPNPQWEETRGAHDALSSLIGLTGHVLHPDRGGGIRPVRGISAEIIAEKFGNSVEEVVATLGSLVGFLWKRHRGEEPFPGNPYEQINRYMKESLKGITGGSRRWNGKRSS